MLVPGVRKRVAAGAILIALLTAGCAQATPKPQPATGTAVQPEIAQPPPAPPSPLDGRKAQDEAALQRRPMAVMFDNHPNARPQTGLNQAEVVYEILAEGGITRFMGLFLREQPEVIGPVRSARHYFVQLAAEFDPYYVHVGFSPQARAEIDRLGILNLDDGKGAGGFFRSADRKSPHNLYISLPKARAWADQRGWEKKAAPRAGFKFAAEPQLAGKTAKALRISIPGAYQGYYVEYAYDDAKGAWLRSVDGEPHVDAATSEQLAARTVVVQFVPTRAIPGDTAGRIDMDIVGSGRAQIFAAGQVVQGRWRKPGVRIPTSFVDADGKPIEFAPGQVWIQVLPTNAEVTVR